MILTRPSMFAGIQVQTLIDFPGRIAAAVFVKGCNFRCPWCHNADFAYKDPDNFPSIDEEEILSTLENRKAFLDGLVISGGEPSLYGEDILHFAKKVKALGYALKLDTNGYDPDFIEDSIGLFDFIAMDVKNSFEKYPETCGLITMDIGRIRKSIEFIKRHFSAHQFRTTKIPGLVTDEDLDKIRSYIGEELIVQEYKNRNV